MASIKESNTSKTAHVMNLLSKNRGTAPAENTADTPASESSASVPTASPQTPPIIASINADVAVSSQIKDALESALEAEAEITPQAPPPPHEEEQQDTPKAVPQPPAQEELPPAQPEPFPVVEEPPDSASQTEVESDLSYVNVMQLLVEEKVGKYMEMFGVCQCPRCKIDVKALALNSLPPKYVVMSKNEFVPRLTVYEGKFSSAITAQILRACNTVMDLPHHNR